jgi:hypothetical protein
MTVAEAIAECLSLHAEAMAKLGTHQPELDDRVDPALRDKIVRQRAKVSASVEGDPEQHRLHVEALIKGLRIVLRRLMPAEQEPPAPPLPVWDAAAKAWRIPDPGQVDTGDPSRPFDDRVATSSSTRSTDHH